MKKIYLFLTALLLTVAAGAQTTIKGDVNGDGTVDIADVTEVVNIILNPDSDDDTPALPDTPTITTGEAIDLGLSVKWASCNVGATAPEEYGGYYAWGETEEKSDYSWKNYKYLNNAKGVISKYCSHDDGIGVIDNKTTLEPADDVASVKWGGKWRMPTLDEIKELKDNCTWEWTTLDGVNGYRVTGPNSNSIFLPAAGYRYGTEIMFLGLGHYWSSSLGRDSSQCGYVLGFNSDKYDRYIGKRYIGNPVRPVCP